MTGFGHAPVVINMGQCSGCERCPDEEREVCTRCITVTWDWGWILLFGDDPNDTGQSVYRRTATYRSVDWPCATAVALGLAERNDW